MDSLDFPLFLLLASFFCFLFFCCPLLLQGAWTLGSRGCCTRWQTWLEATEHVLLSTFSVSYSPVCVCEGVFYLLHPKHQRGGTRDTHVCVCLSVCVCMPRDANLSGNIWKSTTPSRLRSLVSCLLWFFPPLFFSLIRVFPFPPYIFFCGANLFLFLLVIHSLFTLSVSLETKESRMRRGKN
jgi:nucleoside recognition membrane protein YjiH